MTREEFDNLVRAVETGIGRHPSALRWRVAWLALLGYGLLLTGLFLVVLLAAGFFAVMYWTDLQGKIVCGVAGVVILFGGGWVVLRALLVRVPPPEGVPVQRDEAPALFALLDDLRSRLRSVPFHHVRLVPVHNAGVVQVPRLGLLGWSSNYLLLGLPLMDGHSPNEIHAILAHEFAHLSRQHGRFSHWIYRLRRSWETIFEQLSRPQVRGQVSLRPLIVRCVDFFWPRFNAHAFVFSRANEYEADAVAARLAGADEMAGALMRLAVHDRVLDQKFWPDLWQLANSQAQPPSDVLTRLRDALRAEPSPEDRERWLAEALRLPTTNADTHPCLTDRLRALGRLPERGHSYPPVSESPTTQTGGQECPRSVAAPATSAAQVLLGPALDQFRAKAETLWGNGIKDRWAARHAKAGALSHRLASLDQAVPDPAADADSLWERAMVLLDLKGDEAVEPILRQVLSLRPDHVPANFHFGRILLEKGRDEGETHVERAMAEDDEIVPRACALLHQHYRRAGRPDRLHEIELRLDRYEKDLEASRAERREVNASDPLIPHGLSPEELRALRETLAADPDLAVAELARKELRHFPKQKLFLLCVRRLRPWHRLPNADRDQALVNRLTQTVRLPGRVLIFTRSGGFSSLARKLRTVAGVEVFRR
jgi:Zn-dependent protease with chaperone function